MRLSSKTWYGISLMCLLGAIGFWWLGNRPPASVPPPSTPEPPATNQPKVPPPPPGTNQDRAASPSSAPNPYPLLSALAPSNPAAVAHPAPTPIPSPVPSTPRSPQYPYRLSNTPTPAKQLARSDTGLLLQNALFDTAQPLDLPIPETLRATEPPDSYVIQARGPLTDRFRQYLKAAGAEIISYIPNNAYLVRVNEAGAQKMAGLGLTQAVLPWEPYYKLEPSLLALAMEDQPLPNGAWLNVVLFPTETLPDLGVAMVGVERTPFGPMITVQAPVDSLATLARRADVQSIAPFRARRAANDLTRVRLAIATNTVVASNYLNLTGSGVLVNVNDRGVDENHPDLSPRVYLDPLLQASLNEDMAHGTHVVGTLASDGANGPAGTNAIGSTNGASFRGLAHEATVFVMPFATNRVVGGVTSVVSVADTYLQERAAISNSFLVNNSWGYVDDPFYDIHAASYDLAVRDALPGLTNSQPLCIVFAAGNVGGGDPDGTGGFASGIDSPATAKNVITVGAIENRRLIRNEFVVGGETNQLYLASTDSDNEVAEFSSRGNVGIFEGEGDFGRFKPDVVAPGVMVVSTRPRNWTNPDTNMAILDTALGTGAGSPYGYENGTSMAAASVSGLLALMQQYFEQRRGMTNSPALMKALLINGARSLQLTYDYALDSFRNYQGWGLANLTNSLPNDLTTNLNDGTSMFVVDQNPAYAVATQQTQTWTLTLTTNAQKAPLRVTLVWTDPPGHPSANLVKLVNDLDLIVTATTATTNGVVISSYVGNNFPLGSVYSVPADLSNPTNTGALNAVRDLVNNVENVYLEPPLADTYQISVVGQRVNVNAVTAHTNGVVQDFALVVSTDNRTNVGPIRATAQALATNYLARVDAVVSLTNGVPFFKGKERAGANSPLMATNTTVVTNGLYLSTGAWNQWNFYTFNTGTSTGGAAFVLFNTPWALNLSRVRTNEADIDLYVSTDPSLTNLSAGLLGATNLLRSTGRGGYEFVWVSNAPPNQTFYVGVKSEDQQAAEYGLFAGIFTGPDGNNTNGPILIEGYPMDIPDGSPDDPQAAIVIAVNPFPITVQNVVVTNEIFHEFGGDLLGHLQLNDGAEAVLNNHRGFSGLVEFVWDDSGSGLIPVSLESDGPPTLRNFAGEEGQGLWILTMVDNALFHTGRVERLAIYIEPQPPMQYFRNGFGYSASGVVLPQSWARYTVDVPADATNLTVCLQPENGPLELFLRYGQDPDTNNFDHYALVDPNPSAPIPPNGCITVTPYDSPPLRQGRYYIGVHNPNGVSVNYQLQVRVERDLRPNFAVSYRSSGPTDLLDDAVTNSVITVPENSIIASVDVGVRIVHPRASDLVMHLVSPQGTRLLLAENRGGYSPDGYGVSALATNYFSASEACTSNCNDPTTNIVDTTFTEGIITVDYQFFGVPDRMTIYYDNALIFDSTLISGAGSFEVPFGPGLSTNIVIVMNQDSDSSGGTWWDFSATVLSGHYIYTTFTENTNLTVVPIKFGIPPFTNNVIITNLNIPELLSGFESAAATNYGFLTNFEGWSVDSGQVEVDQDPSWAHTGTQFLALANGSITRSLPTIPGAGYRLTYAVHDPGIVGWWAGEGDASDTISTNAGLELGGLAYVPGLINQAFSFDGTNGYVRIPAAADLDVGASNGLTIECWINPFDVTAERPLVEWNDGAGALGAHLWLAPITTNGFPSPGALYANLVDTSGNDHTIVSANNLVTPGASGTNNYQHVAVTYSPFTGEARLYLNGTIVQTQSFGVITPATASDLYVGHHPSGVASNTIYWGQMDELSLYRRALTPTEIGAIYSAGLGVFPEGKCSTPSCLPNATVAVQSVPRPVYGSPRWQTNSFNFTATEANTYFDVTGNPLSVLLDTVELTPVRAPAYFLPEEPLNPLRGQSSFGDWTLEIWDNRVGAYLTNVLLSWKLDFMFLATNPPATLLAHDQCYTNTLYSNDVAYFIVDVPPVSRHALQQVISHTGLALDFFFNQNGLPSGNTSGDTNSPVVTGGGDLLLTDDATNGVAVIFTNFTYVVEDGTGGVLPAPTLQRGRRYYLAVQNSDPATISNQFEICLRFDRVGSGAVALVLLTNAVTYTNCVAAGGDLQHYQFNASTNAEMVILEILNPDGDVNLFARRGPPLPTPTNFVHYSTNSGASNELIEVFDETFAQTAGTWYLGVHNNDTNTVCYGIRATEILGIIPIWLTNDVPYFSTNCAGLPPPPEGIDYYALRVSTNAAWLTFDVFDMSEDVDLIVSYGRPVPILTRYDYLSANPGTNAEQVMVLTNSSPVALTNGDWYIGVVHVGLTNSTNACLTYTLQATEHTNAPPVITDLTNAVALATNVLPGVTNYYRFPVSDDAVQANFEVQFLSGDVDLFIKHGLPLPGASLFDYASTNAGTDTEFIAVATNSVPVPLVLPDLPRTNDWYLAVVNPGTNTVDFTIQVTEFVPGLAPGTNLSVATLTNWLVVVTNEEVYVNTLWTNRGEWNLGGDYYLLEHTNSADWALFEVLWSDGPVSLYVTNQTLLPTYTNNAYFSVNPGTNYEQAMVATNSRPVPWTNGPWFFTVARNAPLTTNLSYAVRVRLFTGAPTNVVDLTNAVPLTNALVAAGQTNYYRFGVSNAAVQANFELQNPSANVDLYLRPSSSLPGEGNFVYASTNAGTADEFIAVATNSVPVPLVAPGRPVTNDWFLAVVNTNNFPVTYALQATEFVPEAAPGTNLAVVTLTNHLIVVTNEEIYVNTMRTNRGEWNLGGDYYLFDPTNRADWVLFEVLWSDGPVSLYVTNQTLLPTYTNNAYFSVNPGTNYEHVLIATNSRPVPWTNGPWFFTVARNDPLITNLTYAVRVRLFAGAPTNLVDLTNAVPLANVTVPPRATNYYRFAVTNAAVQAHFELRDLTNGNVDLYVRPSSSLPGPDNYVYAGTNLGTNAEFIAIATNSVPVPLVAPGRPLTNDWFVAVVNQDTNPVTYAIQATEYVPVTNALTNLLFVVAANTWYTNTMVATNGEWNLGADHYLFAHTNGAVRWVLFEVAGTNAPVSLFVTNQTLLPTWTNNAYFSVNPATNYQQVLIVTNSRPVALTNGPWFFSVIRNQPLGSNDLSYAFRVQTFTNPPPVVRALVNAVSITNAVAPQATNYYRFGVSAPAVQAHFELRDLTNGNVDLYVRPSSSLPGDGNFVYASLNAGSTAEFIAVATNSVPVPLVAPGLPLTNDWFLAVVNPTINPVTYAIQATEFVPDTPRLVQLTNGLAYPHTVGVTNGDWNLRSDFYLYAVTNGPEWVSFEVLNANGPVDLVLRRETLLPALTNYDYLSVNLGTNDEQVLLLTNSQPVALADGAWFLGVPRATALTADLTYTVRATQFATAPPVITRLPGGVPVTDTIAANATNHFVLALSNAAVQANFEIQQLTGNVDLYLRPGSGLAGPADFVYASTNAGTNVEFMAVATNSLPVALTHGEWSLALVNRETNNVDYALQVTEFVPGTAQLPLLADGVAYTNTVPATNSDWNLRTDYFLFPVTNDLASLTFEVFTPSEPVDLAITNATLLPTLTNAARVSANAGLADESIPLTNSVVALSNGVWFVGVQRAAALTNDLTYTVSISARPISVVAPLLPSGAARVAAVAPAATDFYEFEVSPAALETTFELRNLDGNADLFVKAGMPLPGPGLFAYASTNAGSADEWISVTPASMPEPLRPGKWYLAVVNQDAATVNYAVTATQVVEPSGDLQIVDVRLVGGQLQVVCANTVPGTSYQLQGTLSLSQPNWLAASPPVMATAAATIWRVPLTAPYAFFRVAVGAAPPPAANPGN